MLTSAGCDERAIFKRLLTSAYGVNIGEQVFEKLNLDDDSDYKIKWNIIKSQY